MIDLLIPCLLNTNNDKSSRMDDQLISSIPFHHTTSVFPGQGEVFDVKCFFSSRNWSINARHGMILKLIYHLTAGRTHPLVHKLTLSYFRQTVGPR